MSRTPYLLILLISLSDFSFSQNRRSDSLHKKLIIAKNIGQKIDILNLLASELRSSDPDNSLKYLDIAATLSQEQNDKRRLSESLNLKGVIYNKKGEYAKALSFHLKALMLREELHDSLQIANSLNNIGLVYFDERNNTKALSYFSRALEMMIKKAPHENRLLANVYNNLGRTYYQDRKYDKALNFYKHALKIHEEGNNTAGIAGILNNLGSLYEEMGDNNRAMEYYLRSLDKQTMVNNKIGISNTLYNIGYISLKLNDYDNAAKYFRECIKVSKEIGYKELEMDSYLGLADMYSKIKQFDKAFASQQLHMQIKDSIFNAEKEKELGKAEAEFEYKKKLIQQESQQQSELDRQKEHRNYLMGGFAVMVALAVMSYRGYRAKRKAHLKITEQKALVEEKNKNILDSINYAKRIQEALLKEEEHVSKHLPEHFILFKPKDIVSGDFYWTFEKQDYLYVAVADCTGHGVPGAFMSMLGIAFLNEITAAESLLTTAQILEKLRDKIISELSQTGKTGESKDGMDISLVRINLLSQEIQWSGANNPLWIIDEKKQFNEIKADKQPIGFHYLPLPFTLHTLNLHHGDTIYLFTDGYADQFGGGKAKKFKYSRLKDLFEEINDKAVNEQKEALNITFENWKGDLEQVDDVCVVVLKI